MVKTNKFDLVSGASFFLAYVCGILRYLPIPLIALPCQLLSGIFNCCGYLFWLAACRNYPHQARKKNVWYGFTESNHQQRIAAIVGMLAAACTIVGCLFPPVLLAAFWLFTITNAFWLVAAFHQKNNPRLLDHNYSPAAQKNYYYYACALTTVSVMSAIAATAAFIFPPAAPLILIASFAINGLLVLIGARYFIKSFVHAYEQTTLPQKAQVTEAQVTNSEKMSSQFTAQRVPKFCTTLQEPKVTYGDIIFHQIEENSPTANPYRTFEPLLN